MRFRGTTRFAFRHTLQALKNAWRVSTPLPHRSEGGKTTFRLLCCMGATHLVLLAHDRQIIYELSELSSVSRSRKGSEGVRPFRPFTICRIAVGYHPCTMFDQRGSDSLSIVTSRI